MTIVLTIIHVVVCFFLVVVVLLQSGKAADLAGAFGGMGSQTVFGPRGSATVLSRATTVAAARSEEHTSELQSRFDLVCRLLLEKKKKTQSNQSSHTTSTK